MAVHLEFYSAEKLVHRSAYRKVVQMVVEKVVMMECLWAAQMDTPSAVTMVRSMADS